MHRFRCERGHYPRISPLGFLHGGCPHCRGAETSKIKMSLAEALPEVASQWHPSRNGPGTPADISWDSKRPAFWRANCCGFEWEDRIINRDKYQRLRCPKCRTLLGSLAWCDPGLAAEWSPTNPITPWHVRPHTSTTFTPEWRCANNPRHTWFAPLSGRSNGSECPECKQFGKSRVELDHYAAATEVFGSARSGVTVRNTAFTTRRCWACDITVSVEGSDFVIEYDGAYWHSAPAKVLMDERKSLDLLAAGFFLVRLREDSLAPLRIVHPRYREVRVYSVAPRPLDVMNEIHSWVTATLRG